MVPHCGVAINDENDVMCLKIILCYPPCANISLKMDGWKTTFLLGWPMFRCELLVLGSVVSQGILWKGETCPT